MPFVDYLNNDSTNPLRRVCHSQQYANQDFLDEADPKVVEFANRIDPNVAAREQGKANARNTNSLPALIQSLKNAGVI